MEFWQIRIVAVDSAFQPNDMQRKQDYPLNPRARLKFRFPKLIWIKTGKGVLTRLRLF